MKRTFEEHPGVIRGHTHLADGAEASIVGSIAALREGDQFMATYRCHGYPIALGTPTKAMMAEIYGKKTGLCGGYGGSMHLVDVDRGFLGTSGIVAQGIPQATGVAWAAQIRKRGPGRPLLLRRRRVQAGRVPRVAEHRVAVEAADRLRDGEQRLQRPHAQRAGGRQRRGRRAAGGQGGGVQHARGHRRRRRPRRGPRDGRGGGRRGRAAARARRSSSRASTASARTATSSPRRASRCTSPSTRRSRSSARPRSTRRRCAATRSRASARASSRTARSAPRTRTGSRTRSATRCRPRSTSGSRARFPDPERTLDHVYA